MSTATIPLPANPREQGYPVLSSNVVQMHLGIAAHVLADWKRMIKQAIDEEQYDQLYAHKDQYRTVVAQWIGQLDAFISFCMDVYGPDYADPAIAVLAEAQKGRRLAEEFATRIFSRWTTQDDFEMLLAEETAIPLEVFVELARKYPPPEEWLQREESRPW